MLERHPRHGLIIRRHIDRIDVRSTGWTQRLTTLDQVKLAARPVLAGSLPGHLRPPAT